MRVLVIDDNPDDRHLVMHEVQSLFPDASIVELTMLEEFETALSADEPDLVLTDLDLRWSNGREILMAVKASYPRCPVVMFTGTGDETIAVDLMKCGLDDYVVKSPRQLPRLRASLKMAVDLAHSRATLSDREHHLAMALAQQQVITRELHHRVKNNLQTISGLLHLSGQSTDEATRATLNEIAGRMDALGAVQSRIYETAELDRVDFNAALSDIAASLIEVHHPEKVTLITRYECALKLDVARAMPLSLICYEIILNAMKHAWPSGSTGTLTVGSCDQVRSTVSISDDGIGFTTGEVVAGLGSRVVRALAREARVAIETPLSKGSGTTVLLVLK